MANARQRQASRTSPRQIDHAGAARAKRAINLTVDAELAAQAKSLGIHTSAVFERALFEEVQKKTAERWLAENQAAIKAYNASVANGAVFSDGLRSF